MAKAHVWEGKTRLEDGESAPMGQRIYAARQKYQITQKVLAAQMHCTQSHISAIEKGLYRFQDSYDRAFNAIAEIVVLRQESERMRHVASLRQHMAMGASA